MSLAFNEINFKLGVFQKILDWPLEELFKLKTDQLAILTDAMDTTIFAEEYPWDDLGDLSELQDFFPEMYQPNESQLWGKLLEEYIIPVAYKLAKFTVEYEDLADVRLNRDERIAWDKLVQKLSTWEKVPHMPNLYAGLAAA